MLRKDESETALPQKERLSFLNCGQPSAKTSVAVSDRAQQKDCGYVREDLKQNFRAGHTKSRSRSPFAAFVRYTIALSVRYVQSAKHNLVSFVNWNWPQC